MDTPTATQSRSLTGLIDDYAAAYATAMTVALDRTATPGARDAAIQQSIAARAAVIKALPANR